MLVPALAVGLWGRVALGLSLDLFAGLTGPVTAREGQAGEMESSVFLDFVTTVRPTPSISVRPGKGISLALTFHPEFSVPYDLDVDARVSGMEMIMHVRGRALYTPHTLVLGFGWTGRRLRASLDLAWAAWSRLGSPFVEVETRILEVGLLTPSNPGVKLRDTLSVKAGLEATVLGTDHLDLLLRGGYGYESPVVGRQSGRSNLFDGHKHTLALGLSTAWSTGSEALPRFIVDLHVGVVLLSELTHTKSVSEPGAGRDDPGLIVDEDETVVGTQVSNPGYPSITGGGWMTTMAATVTLEIR
jgi:hypothetical protein